MHIPPFLQRLQLLTGDSGIEGLRNTRVILFGVGGVGSWCAEALIRSGVGTLTMVDSDLICVTNINRQVQALVSTIGRVKVTEMAKRLREINPDAHITSRQELYDRKTKNNFALSEYDYVIDAIDSLSSKVELMCRAHEAGVTLYSALGASCRLNPGTIKVGSIWQSKNCRLGRFVRKRLRRRGFSGDFLCVYSDEEILQQHEATIRCGTENCVCPKRVNDNNHSDDTSVFVHEWCSAKKQINGSVVHMSGIYGFLLSGLVVQDVTAKNTLKIKVQ